MVLNLYSDVIKSEMIQKRKEKYTLSDARRISKKYSINLCTAKWVLLCSAAYWREYQRKNGEKITITCTKPVFKI